MTEAEFDPGDLFDPELAQRAEVAQYEHVVDQDDAVAKFIQARKQAYATVFGNAKDDPYLRFVLDDLAFFCRAFTPPYDPDPRRQDVKIGRMDVFYRIYEHTHLPVETLFLRYTDALSKLQQNGRP